MRDLVFNRSFGRGTTLRRFFRIASRRLLRPVCSDRRSLAIPDAIDTALVRLLGNQIEPELFAHHTGKKAAHGMLLPFRCSHDGGDRRASGCPQHRDDAGVLGVRPRPLLRDPAMDRACNVGLPVFRAAGRVPAFGLDLGLVMGSSEVCATPSAAPPRPRLGKSPAGQGPRSAPQPLQVTTATLRSGPKASQF